MAEVKGGAVGGEEDGVPQFEKILQSLSQQDAPSNERVRAYMLLQELLKLTDSDKLNRRVCEDMLLFCRCIQRDVVSSSEEIALLALKILGFLLHRRSFVTNLPDDEACKFLLTLLALITTTGRKLVCSLGLWCLAVQELKTSLLTLHLKMIIAVVLHGIDNPLGSMGITYEAVQTIMHLTRQLPREMRDLSWTWAPTVYEKLLNSNSKTAELAEKCLSGTQSALLPPLPKLTEVVAADIQDKLLQKLGAMIKLERRSACAAIQAWGWLVKLLGSRFFEEKSLINKMLHLIEESFVSQSAPVRVASQVAWVSLIDAFVPTQGNDGASGSPVFMAPPFTAVQCSPKRLKLLMMPLLNSMQWEKDLNIQRNCCRTWIYLLCRLGQRVNEEHIFETAVVPMLEIVFKLSPQKRDGHVWQVCVDLMMNVISSNGSNGSAEALVATKEAIQSPKTPNGITYSGIFSGSHYQNIKWSYWYLERLDSLLKTVRLLWTCGVEQLDEVKSEEHAGSFSGNLEAARECWKLLVRAVENEERNSVRPSNEHVAAVHLLLEFFSGVCTGQPSKTLPCHIWGLAETLINVLRPVVIASSFYRIRLQFAELPCFVMDENGESGSQRDSVPDTVTPIVYLSAAWLKMAFESPSDKKEDDIWLHPVEKLLTTGRAGFDVMGNYYGFAWILDHLGVGRYQFQEQSPSIKNASNGVVTKPHNRYSMSVWRILAKKLKEHVERSNDVPPVGGCQHDSGYEVVSSILLFPIKSILLPFPLEYQERRGKSSETLPPKVGSKEFGSSEADLFSVEGTWCKLYDSVQRVASLKNTRPNSFTSRLFGKAMKVLNTCLQGHDSRLPKGIERVDFDYTGLTDHCLRLLGNMTAHAMNHVEISNLAMLAISRKRRKTGYGAASVRVQHVAGMELEDANNLKDLFAVASRFLTLASEMYKQQRRQFSAYDSVHRVFGGFASLAQHISSQNDSVLLLQALCQPVTCWLTVGSEAENPQQLPHSLLAGLAQAWDGLLLCLQTCRPCLVFDSNLLLAQAPSLAAAFLHHNHAICKRTLAFWECTYGLKAVTLKYPLAMVKVFSKLEEGVHINLPGWNMRTVEAKEGCSADAPENLSRQPLAKVGRHFGERMQYMMKAVDNHGSMRENVPTFSGGSQEKNRGTSNQVVVEELSHQRDEQRVHFNLLSGTAEPECAVNCTASVSLDQKSKFMSTPEGNAVIDALMNMDCDSQSTPEEILERASSDPVSISPPPEVEFTTLLQAPNAAGTMGGSQAIAISSPLEITKFLQTSSKSTTEIHLSSSGDNQHEPTAELQNENPGQDAAATLVTSPIAFDNVPSIPPKNAVGAEQHTQDALAANGEALQSKAAADVSKVGESQAGSKLPRRRKKLKFQDDSQVEYTVIPPQMPKKNSGPLTARQKEVRSAQRTGGRVPKTYTAADFSQSGIDSLEDSQMTSDGALEANCKENIPSNLLRIQSECGDAAICLEVPRNPAAAKAATGADEREADVRTVPLEEVDYGRLTDRLKALWQEDPTLTFRQVFVREQYEHLPRLIQQRLRSFLSRRKAAEVAENAAARSAVEEDDPTLIQQRSTRLLSRRKAAEVTENARAVSAVKEHDPRIIQQRSRSFLSRRKAVEVAENAAGELVAEEDDPTLIQQRSNRSLSRRKATEVSENAENAAGGSAVEEHDPTLIPQRSGCFLSRRKAAEVAEHPVAGGSAVEEDVPTLIQHRSRRFLSRRKEAQIAENDAARSAVEGHHPPDPMRSGGSAVEDHVPPNSRRSGGSECEERTHSSRQSSRRRSDYNNGSASMRSVTLRSSGKLRGGKHWRIHYELGRVITSRLGMKKIIAKRQRICSNLVSKINKLMPPAIDIVQAECCSTLWGSQIKKDAIQEIAIAQPEEEEKESPSLKMHEDSLFTVKASCNELISGLEAQHRIGLEASSGKQENSPFRVRNLNRGLLASAYGVFSGIADGAIAQDFIHGCPSTRSKSHNPRKCRAPKRIPSIDANPLPNPSFRKTTTASVCPSEEEEEEEASKEFMASWTSSDEVQPEAPSEINEEVTDQCRSTGDKRQSPRLLVCIEIEGPPLTQNYRSVAEGKEVQRCFLHESRRQLDEASSAVPVEDRAYDGLPIIDVDFQTPVTLPGGFKCGPEMCTTSEMLAAAGLHSQDLSTIKDNPQTCMAQELGEDTGGKEMISEVHSLVEREDVRVCQVLTALLASSKWKQMDGADVVEAEKLLIQLGQLVFETKGDRGKFETPPAHF